MQFVALSQTLDQRLEQRLAQIIDLANLMSVPDEIIHAVIKRVNERPESVESLLRGRRNKLTPADSKSSVQAICSSFPKPIGDTPQRIQTGIILSPNLKCLESQEGSCQVEVTPDVTYIGRLGDKPEIIFSDHLKGSMGIMLIQVDASRYPETSKLMSQLKRFDDWKRQTLQNAYVVIGGKQREFLEYFDITRLNVFRTTDLADKMNLSESTIYRLLCNRLAELRNVRGDRKVSQIEDLLVTPDELTRYLAIPTLNEAFREEFERGKALSDQQILRKAPHIARRTIAKYRLSAGIPSSSKRTRSYRLKERKVPYNLS